MERVVQKLAGAAALALIATGCSCVADFRSFEIEGDGGAPVDAEADGGGGLAYDAIVAGDEHFCVLSAGEVACWGDNEWSVLGPSVPRSEGSSRNDSGRPLLALAGETEALDLHDAVCAVQGGEVFCWGSTTFGQLGDGVRLDLGVRAEPAAVSGLPPVQDVAVGLSRACAVAGDGIWCWGTVRRLGDAGTFEEVRFDAEPARLPR